MLRPFYDKMIWTHAPLIYAAWRCYKKRRIEMGTLTTTMIALSIFYHRHTESIPMLNFIENSMGRLFSIYAVLHAIKCKHHKMQKIELVLMFIGYFIYYSAGYGHVDYEKWHWLNHVWPATWLIILIEKHDGIFI